jgi:UDP-glucose 4-epimerase
MRVAVTGGAGYIGSVVAEVLLEGRHDVLVLDNLEKGHRTSVPDAAGFVLGDIRDRDAVASALREFRAEAVIHMAALSLVGESVVEPAKYYANNLSGGLTLLDAMRDAGVLRMVFSSTAAVYGEPTKQPIEEDDPTTPTNPYGESKLAFEGALRWYGAAYGISSTSLRYFNAAGATSERGERHDPETHLIPIVLEAAAGRRPHVSIFGTDYPTPDGTCVRDYVHVDDLARAHVLALESMGVAGECRVYNLGCGGRGYSVREVIDTATRVTGREIPVRVSPRRAGDPAVLVASSVRIARELGWQPRRQRLDDIVDSAWSWLSERGRQLV